MLNQKTKDNLEDLIHILLDTASNADAEDIADTIWLALKLDKAQFTKREPRKNTEPKDQSPEKDDLGNSKRETEQKDSTDRHQEENEIPVHSDNQKTSNSKSIQGTPFRAPAVRMLNNSLLLTRALRPLHKKVRSNQRYELDIDATVNFIANQGIYFPTIVGKEERWSELTLVIDISVSMTPWKQTIHEFKQLIEYCGIFRNIKKCYLFSDDCNASLKSNQSASSILHPKQILENNQRQIVFILSDCISQAWHSGSTIEIISEWQKKVPVSIIQMLPQRLWSGTALKIAENSNFKTNQSLPLNMQLIEEDWDIDDPQPDLKIPVINIDPISLNSISKILAGNVDSWVTGVSFESAIGCKITHKPDNMTHQEVTAKERVENFFKQASPLARELAGYFAAIPLNIPVMRMVQHTKMPESNQTHFAEVFLSGLIKIRSDTFDSKIEYDFHQGVRDYLLDTISMSEAIKILEKHLLLFQKK